MFSLRVQSWSFVSDEDSDDPVPDTVLQFRDFIFQTSHGVTVDAGTATHNIQVTHSFRTTQCIRDRDSQYSSNRVF